MLSDAAQIAAIQKHLLPASLPAIPGYTFAAMYRPCLAAGGDYYGFQQFADGRLGFLIADVAGHGAGAAVMMAVLRSALAAFRVFGRLRETAAQDCNAIVNDIAVPGVFVTAFLVSLEPTSGEIFCGNCGHPAPLVRRHHGAVEQIEGGGSLPLGIAEEIDPPMIRESLNPGDALVLYTDGLTEARSPAGAFFGEQRVRAVIASAALDSDAPSLLARLVHALALHQADAHQSDDQCIVVCVRDPQPR